MKVTSRFPKLFYRAALVLLSLRELAEQFQLRVFHGASSDRYRRDGYRRFRRGELLPMPSEEILALRDFLDQIETKHRKGDSVAPGGSPDYDYVFMNEQPFYGERLGPRLRLTYPINSFERWPPLAKRILQSEAYRNLLRSHFGTTCGVHKCYIEKTLPGGTEPWWHVDSVSQTNRLVLLLDDVGEEDAPLEYLKGSHLDHAAPYRSVKRRHLLTAESWEPHSRHRAAAAELVKFTGQQGESFLFDARGVHRASLSSEKKSRYVMMISFTPGTMINRFLDLNRGGWPSGVRDIEKFDR